VRAPHTHTHTHIHTHAHTRTHTQPHTRTHALWQGKYHFKKVQEFAIWWACSAGGFRAREERLAWPVMLSAQAADDRAASVSACDWCAAMSMASSDRALGPGRKPASTLNSSGSLRARSASSHFSSSLRQGDVTCSSVTSAARAVAKWPAWPSCSVGRRCSMCR
jgi:hypothetical protein